MTDTPKRAPSPFKRRQRRLLILGLILPAFALATALALIAISQTQVYFYAPTALLDAPAEDVARRDIRIGGLVAKGSLRQGTDTKVTFAVTDGNSTVPVVYDDALPGLVAENEGVVVQGRLGADGVFVASNVLARHDENYMAPEVAAALKESGMYEHYKATGDVK